MAGTQDYAASIQGVALRVTRLDANGNLLNGPGDSYTTSAFMSVSFTPEYEEGDEITQKAASGAVCVTYKAPDTLKRITMELAICEPDPELTTLLGGGIMLRKAVNYSGSTANKTIGWASPAVGDDPSGNGVSIEAWSLAIRDGKRAGTLPYFHWVFPYAKLSQSGDRVIENGLLANTFQGFGLGNGSFSVGPDGRWEFPVATERPYSYARDSYAPTGLSGFYTWHGALTSSVNNKALTSEVATLTTAAAHGYQVGDTVVVSTVGTGFDGTRVVSAVPSTTTFTFASVGASNVASTPVTGGSAVVAPGARSVTDLSDSASGNGLSYNVPGSQNYNPAYPSDYILNSTQNPTT